MDTLSLPPFLQSYNIGTFSLENIEDDVNSWASSDSDISAHSPISEPPSSPQEFNFPASLAIQILNSGKPTDFLFPSLQLPVHRTTQPPPQPSPPTERAKMESFPNERVADFKHVIYNLLVENWNNPDSECFAEICYINENGTTRAGFRFNERLKPHKKLPELYAQHIRKSRLDLQDQRSPFTQDLYKYYLRSCTELLGKYFEKRDKYLYLYEEVPLFVPGSSLEDAEERIKTMKTRSRKKKRRL